MSGDDEAEKPKVVVFTEAFKQEKAEIFACGEEKALSALCLSGGGIRSASFALGVLQGLAQGKVLGKFHYLSTVSGGGYIGSWLSSLIRVHKGNIAVVEQELTALPEPVSITNLREYSRYLTPKAGLASADTWAAAIIVIRNIFLNWLIFAPVLLLTALAVLGYRTAMTLAGPGAMPATLAVLGAAALLLLWATTETCLNLPSHRPRTRPGPNLQSIRWRMVLPALSWAALVPVAVNSNLAHYQEVASLIFGFGLAGTVPGLVLAWLLGAQQPQDTSRIRDLLLWLAVSVISSGLAAAGVLLSGCAAGAWQPIVLAVLGPVWLTLCTMIHASLFVALRKIGRRDLDADREWLARLSAVKVLPTLGWMVLSGAVLALPQAVFVDAGSIGAFLTALTAAISAPVAVLGGKSPASIMSRLGGAKEKGAVPLNRIITIAAVVTILVLLMVASVVAESLTTLLGAGLAKGAHLPLDVPAGRLTVEVGVAGLLSWVLWFTSGRINVNRFSLQGFYRNRLVRAYLAAVRPAPKPTAGPSPAVDRDAVDKPRNPDPFTGFDGDDNPRLHHLRAAKMAGTGKGEVAPERRLLPVVNVTLNLVGGERLAWQERKAEAFTMTPLACGSAMLGPNGAYVSSKVYGGAETNASQPGDGISLGTAMAISGAAVSPAMGYHSSPPAALLMTLFNARLGCWLPNPIGPGDRDYLKRSGPSWALRPLLNEMFGLTNDKQRDIYLSDGGHFDNIGLYEMIRRECHLIFISDAGCDPKGEYADFGQTVRKVRIDFGVDIIMTTPLPGKDTKTCWATGTIVYPGNKPAGLLVYLRPVLVGNLPVDILNYSKTSPDFPNDTTTDQWFTEAQFESYRHLGRYLVDLLRTQRASNQILDDFFNDL